MQQYGSLKISVYSYCDKPVVFTPSTCNQILLPFSYIM